MKPAGRPPGRVLKVRLGFNPNSSSIGTVVVVFLWSVFASAAVLNAVAAALAARRARLPAGGRPGESSRG